MKYFKKLVGERIYLSPRNLEDVEKYTEWMNDFNITDYTGRSHQIMTIEAEKKYLEEKYEMFNISSNMLETFQGSIGKAIILKDKKEQYEKIEMMIKNLDKKDIIDILNLGEEIYKSKDDIIEILEYINVILLKLSKEETKYVKCINIVEDTKKRLKQNANYDMCIDNMILNMWEEVN